MPRGIVMRGDLKRLPFQTYPHPFAAPMRNASLKPLACPPAPMTNPPMRGLRKCPRKYALKRNARQISRGFC